LFLIRRKRIKIRYLGIKIKKVSKIKKETIGSLCQTGIKVHMIPIGMCRSQMAVIHQYIRQKINRVS